MPTPPIPPEPSALSCADVLTRLFEHVDGELPTEIETRVREHLAVCPECLANVRHDQAYLRALRRRDLLPKAPPELRARVESALAARRAERGKRDG